MDHISLSAARLLALVLGMRVKFAFFINQKVFGAFEKLSLTKLLIQFPSGRIAQSRK